MLNIVKAITLIAVISTLSACGGSNTSYTTDRPTMISGKITGITHTLGAPRFTAKKVNGNNISITFYNANGATVACKIAAGWFADGSSWSGIDVTSNKQTTTLRNKITDYKDLECSAKATKEQPTTTTQQYRPSTNTNSDYSPQQTLPTGSSYQDIIDSVLSQGPKQNLLIIDGQHHIVTTFSNGTTIIN